MKPAIHHPYKSLANASDHILTILSEVIGVNTLFIAVNDSHSNFILKSLNRQKVLVKSNDVLPLFETYCGLVTRSNNPVIIANTKQSELTNHLEVTAQLGNTSFVGVPITLPDKTICGTLCGLDHEGYQYSERDINLLTTMATFLGFVAELEAMAFRDPLTRAFNRNFISLFLADDWQNRFQTVAFLFIDIDDFKQLNDTYSHSAGDEILLETVKRIQRHVRQADTVCRVGGDEFVVLLPDYSSPDVLTDMMERILSEFAKPMQIQNEHIPISVSIGVSLYPHDGQDIEQLIKRADTAMYHVKQNGKGAYQLFGGTPNIH